MKARVQLDQYTTHTIRAGSYFDLLDRVRQFISEQGELWFVNIPKKPARLLSLNELEKLGFQFLEDEEDEEEDE